MSDPAIDLTKESPFTSLIREAFIDPIRSVLIIDDSYPTWQKVFDGSYVTTDDTWASSEQILSVINQFRSKSPALTVDIHDGMASDDIGSYLHQSDLLVLDYQLEKDGPKGQRAASIIGELLSNKHFNLVVVHTAVSDLSDPFNHILTSLLRPCDKLEGWCETGAELVAAFEDSGEEGAESISDDLKSSVPKSTYLAYRKALISGKKITGFVHDAAVLSKFREFCESPGWTPKQRAEVFCWVIASFEDELSSEDIRPAEIKWNAPGVDGRPWIRTNRGFIAFANKTNANLLETLVQALEDWKPSPSRMISSKIRAEISAQGVVAEDNALSDKHAYWKYYSELLGASALSSEELTKSTRKTLLEAHAARHVERLLDLIGENAVDYGLRVISGDPTGQDPSVAGFSSHYAVDASKGAEVEKAIDHYNSYVSTKPVSGWHLQPGHIFKSGKDLWVCLSPACDMVPNQKSSIAISGSKSAAEKPFMAVQLHSKNIKLSRDEINSNTIVFLRDKLKNKIDKYSVFPTASLSSSPIWRLFSAKDFGKIEQVLNGNSKINLSYISGADGKLSIKSSTAEIVGQLRYEYALNLIQKLGTELTRVGLDYVTHGED